VADGTGTDEKDVPKGVTKENTVASRSWIALRGPIKVKLEEAFWGRGPEGRVVGEKGSSRRRLSLKGRGRSLVPNYGKFIWSVVITLTRSRLKMESLHDVTIALMPVVLPGEG
jgi:hypothetical protein